MIRSIGIVSLSSGILGERIVSHEAALGLERLRRYGVQVKFLPHARMGLSYLREHPEKRAEDLLAAFGDDSLDMILCAIGGDDTYRLAPYLLEEGRLKKAAGGKKKIFLGFSDSTLNHFMLHKLSINSFYGQAFLPDVCELAPQMLPYTRSYFEELLQTGTIRTITPSPLWYESRKDFSEGQLGSPLPAHENSGFLLLQGSAQFSGQILGGCIDSIFDMFDGTRYEDMPGICKKYGLFPDEAHWRGKILLLESSEEQMPPSKYEAALRYLKAAGVFDAVNGVLVGKPMDEVYHEDYQRLLRSVIDRPELPVVCNLSIGHALPRCIVPFGVMARVDAQKQCVCFDQT